MRVPVWTLIGVLALCGCPAPGGAAKAPAPDKGWKGEFRGESMTVVLDALDDGSLSGKITLDGKGFDLTADVPKDGKSSGKFAADGATFDVTLERASDALTLVTGGTTYKLTRYVPPNPLAKKNPLAKDAAADESKPDAKQEPAKADPPKEVAKADPPKADPPKAAPPQADPPQADSPASDDEGDVVVDASNWATFTHPGGLNLRHPKDWSARQQNQALMLTPNDLRKNAAGQPLEIYLGTVDSAQGVSDPASAQARQLLTQQVRSDFPFMQPVGQVEEAQTLAGRGAIHRFAGTNPLGKHTSAWVHVVVVGPTAICLYAVAETEILKTREASLLAIFATFQYSKPAAPARPTNLDPNLIGYWRHTKTFVSGGFSMVTDEHMVLAADGNCFWNSKSAGGMSHTDSGGNFTGSTTISSDGTGWTYRGTWSVQGDTLTMNWTSHGEQEVWPYYVEGNSMMFKGSKNKLWKLIRR